jgi:hypothetical protein
MRNYTLVPFSSLQVGDVLVQLDNTKWTIRSLGFMPRGMFYHYILARNGKKLRRWELLKETDLFRKLIPNSKTNVK